MTDIHRVFARFRDASPELSPQRKILNIRRRGSAHAMRVVEVVHIKSNPPSSKEPSRRPSSSIRAATTKTTGVDCIRCGYRLQETRARRGLMTCADCA